MCDLMLFQHHGQWRCVVCLFLAAGLQSKKITFGFIIYFLTEKKIWLLF